MERARIVTGTFSAEAATEGALAAVPRPVCPGLIHQAVCLSAVAYEERMCRKVRVAGGTLEPRGRDNFRTRKDSREGENAGSRFGPLLVRVFPHVREPFCTRALNATAEGQQLEVLLQHAVPIRAPPLRLERKYSKQNRPCQARLCMENAPDKLEASVAEAAPQRMQVPELQKGVVRCRSPGTYGS